MRRISCFFTILLFFLFLFTSCNKQSEHTHTTHDHTQFVSAIEKTDCHLCGDRRDTSLSDYLGQENLGLIDLNTFAVEPAPILEYDTASGERLEGQSGTMKLHSAVLAGASVTMMTDPDRGYSRVTVGRFDSKIDPDKISAFLCQTCLDAFSADYFTEDDLPALAVVDFSLREITPLIPCRPWYFRGAYMVDCDFESDGGMELLLIYRPGR